VVAGPVASRKGDGEFCCGGIFVKRVLFVLVLLVLVSSTLTLGITFVDDLGRTVTLPESIQRVVVGAPALTDYLVHLGVETRIVGVTDWDPFPAEKVGQPTPMNVEKIVSLQPDLVLITGGFQAPEAARLEAFDVPVLVCNPNSIQDILRTTRVLGQVFGVPAKASELVAQMESTIDNWAKQKAYTISLDERKTIFYAMIIGNEVKDLWTCGQGSFLNEVFSYAGGTNITGSYAGPNGWLPVSVEFIARQNPDVILVPYYYEGGEQAARETILSFEPWKDVQAVKDKAIFGIDGNKADLPSISLLDLIPDIFQLLYP